VSALLIAVGALGTLAGCGQPEDEPRGLGATPGTGDLVLASGESDESVRSALGSAPGAAPRVVYLAYADGGPIKKMQPDPCNGVAPKFACSFAQTLKECQQQIQAYLDRWYADFNVVFTTTRPTSGWYYMEIISTGGGAWCNASDRVAGIAPFLCNDLQGGVAYTFSGGRTAKETAVIIAQEQAHLVGLEHTLSTSDVMDPTICADCDGFEKVDNQDDAELVRHDAGSSGRLDRRREADAVRVSERRLGSFGSHSHARGRRRRGRELSAHRASER
jgi:hypothetical protein